MSVCVWEGEGSGGCEPRIEVSVKMQKSAGVGTVGSVGGLGSGWM